jgi:hypothetical protein
VYHTQRANEEEYFRMCINLNTLKSLRDQISIHILNSRQKILLSLIPVAVACLVMSFHGRLARAIPPREAPRFA